MMLATPTAPHVSGLHSVSAQPTATYPSSDSDGASVLSVQSAASSTDSTASANMTSLLAAVDLIATTAVARPSSPSSSATSSSAGGRRSPGGSVNSAEPRATAAGGRRLVWKQRVGGCPRTLPTKARRGTKRTAEDAALPNKQRVLSIISDAASLSTASSATSSPASATTTKSARRTPSVDTSKMTPAELRRWRNRVSAAESRKRKRLLVQSLERQVASLASSQSALRSRLAHLATENSELRQREVALLNQLRERVAKANVQRRSMSAKAQ